MTSKLDTKAPAGSLSKLTLKLDMYYCDLLHLGLAGYK
jgi:hypothetical protein